MQTDFYMPEIGIYSYPAKKLHKTLSEIVELLEIPISKVTCVPHTNQWSEDTSYINLLPDFDVPLINIIKLTRKYQLIIDHTKKSKIVPNLIHVRFFGCNVVRILKLECWDKDIVFYLEQI
jgi:hypothetical protein